MQMYFCMRQWNYNSHLNWSLLQGSLISTACISNYCCYWCFLWAGIWGKSALCLQNNSQHSKNTTSHHSFLSGVYRQREHACSRGSHKTSWITSWSMNANQHMYYNTSMSTRHTFICCSKLDCTSVWPKWWNQCRNAHKPAEGLGKRFCSVKQPVFHHEDSYKRGLSQGLGVKLGWPCFALGVCKALKRANRGNCSTTWIKICHSEKLQWKEAFHFSITTFG